MSNSLAIITTHPIQYNAPVFKLLSERNFIKIKVFYTWGESVLKDKYDPGFEKIIEWDIPLLEGYAYQMMNNVSRNPGSHHFNGIVNPNLINEIENWGANAILIYGWSFNSHLKCMRYFKGKIPVFFRGDSTLLDESGNFLKNIMRQCFLKWVYKFVDIAFYAGQANKKYFIHNGLKENQLIFVPHAIDNNRFSKSVIYSFRRNLNISNEKILFVFAGKFESKKNPILLMNAFVSLNDFSTELLFVGNGPLEIKLKEIWNQLSEGVKNRIHFLDFQNQSLMPDLYKALRCFCIAI
jgi:glycosyltransferase involved in cell wall biosynthesis